MPVPLHVIEHPLVHDALIELRNSATAPPEFRSAANRISVLLAAEALRDVPSTAVYGELGTNGIIRVTTRRTR